MKASLAVLLAAALAATLASSVAAMPAGDTTAKGSRAYPMDCNKAKDKARCESLNKDIEGCKGKTDDEWRACMRQAPSTAKFTPPKPRDCSKARNKESCEAHTSALEACKDKTTRADHRKCLAEQLPGARKG
jgi:hypothetical protein